MSTLINPADQYASADCLALLRLFTVPGRQAGESGKVIAKRAVIRPKYTGALTEKFIPVGTTRRADVDSPVEAGKLYGGVAHEKSQPEGGLWGIENSCGS